jgi:hypothetical protein
MAFELTAVFQKAAEGGYTAFVEEDLVGVEVIREALRLTA